MKPILFSLIILSSLKSFSQCPVAPGVTLSSQTAVDNFSVTYPGCVTMPVGSDLIIMGNNITNLNGLNAIQVVNGAVEIRSNPLLISTAGFAPTFAGSDLIIRDNAILQNINSLINLDTILGEFTIRTNPSLTNISGLNALTTVGSAAIIRDNATLTNLNGLNNLRTTGDVLEIVENPLLTDVSALSSLDSITGGLEGALVIDANDILANLNGLGNNNTKIKGDLIITNNPLLTYCSVLSICNYLNNPPAGATTTISLNDVGCNTEPEVQSQCLTVNLSDYKKSEHISFYPNPAETYIEVLNQLSADQEIMITNALGEVVSKQYIYKGKNLVSVEHLSSGVYYLQFSNSEKNIYKKLVIN